MAPENAEAREEISKRLTREVHLPTKDPLGVEAEDEEVSMVTVCMYLPVAD